MTCDCQGAAVCERQRQRLEVCSPQVIDAMKIVKDETTQITCTLAEWICRADTQCFTALGYYDQHCRKLIRGEKCTRRCNNSLSILYRQTKAQKLRTCVCDGTEPYNCPELRENTDEMCFGVKIRHPGHKNHTRPGGSGANAPPPGHKEPGPREEGKNISCEEEEEDNEVGYNEVEGEGYRVSSASRDVNTCAVTLLVTLVTLLNALSDSVGRTRGVKTL